MKKKQIPQITRIPGVPISNRSGAFHWALLPYSHLSSTPFSAHFLSLQARDGSVALHWASVNGHLECVIALLEAGANIDKQTFNGHTPLMDAARWSKIEVVRELLKQGADKKLKNKGGKTAHSLASNKEVKKLLGGGGFFSRMFGGGGGGGGGGGASAKAQEQTQAKKQGAEAEAQRQREIEADAARQRKKAEDDARAEAQAKARQQEAEAQRQREADAEARAQPAEAAKWSHLSKAEKGKKVYDLCYQSSLSREQVDEVRSLLKAGAPPDDYKVSQ